MYHPPNQSRDKRKESREPREITAIDAMMKLITTPTVDSIGRISSIQLVYFLADMLKATMYSLKATVKSQPTWRVFIQDWAASLNRKGLLSNTNTQLFREWAYDYMRAEQFGSSG
jgi:hypothetical protein